MDQMGTPIAGDDSIIVNADETSGDNDLDVLANDVVEEDDGSGGTQTVLYMGDVLAVNGSASNIGTWVQGSNGGLFWLDLDGTLDFDASTIDFNDTSLILNSDGSLTTTITYTIGTFSTEEVCVEVPYMPPSYILTEDVWFGSVNSGPCVDGSTDGVNTIEWDYHKGDDKLTLKLKIDDDKALFGDNSENAEVISADLSGIEQTLTSLGAHTIEINKFNFTDKGLEIEIKGYGIDLLNGSDNDDLIEEYMNLLLGDDIEIPLTVIEDGEQRVMRQLFCIDKYDSHSPIAFDLTGDGKIGTTGVSTAQNRIDNVIGATVMFDIDADGERDEIEWMDGAGDGLLFDASQGSFLTDGIATGANLFGDQGGLYANGYIKLAGRDADSNGRIEGTELDGLEIWVDDGDAVVETGELQSLSGYGIQAISVEYREVLNERGEVLIQSVAVTDTGTTGSESTTELETCENAFVCFDFETTATMLTEDVWFASGPCIDGDTDGVGDIEWDYHKGEDRLTFILKIDDDKALFGANSETAEVITADMSGIEQILLDLGATSIDFDKFRFTDKGLEIKVEGYGIDFLNGSNDDDLIEQLMNQLLGDDVIIPLTIEVDGVQSTLNQRFCIDKYDSHSPIAFDLNGDGRIGTTGVSTAQNRIDNVVGATVLFDIDGDGDDDLIEWMNGDGDGLLVDNRDGNAAADMSGARLFGDQGGLYANGYEKLALLDANSDGQISDTELDGLELWIDDGDAVVEAGELQSLADHGILSIATDFDRVLNDRGEVLQQSTATVDAEASGRVTYRLLGPDAHLFELDATTGKLSIIDPPDFENPQDEDGNNIYEVVVERTLDGVVSTENVSINVKDCDDTATVSVTVLPPPVSSISGRYWCDENGDDREQPEEEGFQESLVTLQRWDGTDWVFAAETLTGTGNEQGEYSFTDLEAATYRVVFAEPVGKSFVTPNVGQTGSDDIADDSDVTEVLGDGSGATSAIVLAAGQDLTDVDAGAAEIEPDSTVIANDDTFHLFFADFDQVTIGTEQFFVYTYRPIDGPNILVNDTDPDGDNFAVTSLDPTGPGTGVAGDPDFGVLDLAGDGTFQLILSDDEAEDLFGYGDPIGGDVKLGTRFEYEITDDSALMATDMAFITIYVDTMFDDID